MDIDLLLIFGDRRDRGAGHDLAAPSAHDFRHRRDDQRVIDDAGARHEQGAEAADVGFARAQLVGVELVNFDAVVLGALVERVGAVELERRRGDEELAADLERDAVLGCERLRRDGAPAAEIGLEAARRVVDARVDHAAVVAGLVAAEAGFLLQ